MLSAVFRAILRYCLRVAIWCSLAILAIVLLLRAVLPALLPEVLNEVSRHLRVNYGLNIAIESPTLTWQGTAPTIRADHFDFSGLQNAAFSASDVDIRLTSLLDFLRGNPGRVTLVTNEIIIRPEVSKQEASSSMAVPIKRNPYDQLIGLKPFIQRVSLEAERIHYLGSSSQLLAPRLRIDFKDKISFQFTADPTNTVIEGFNITGRLLPEQQVVSFDVTPSALSTKLLSTLGLEPLTPFHLKLDAYNFYNRSLPFMRGKLFQGGHKFAELTLNDTRWHIDHIDYGRMAQGDFYLGAGFGWDLYGQLLLDKWLRYGQSLPAYQDQLAGVSAGGSIDFSVFGTSPLIPSKDFSVVANEITIETEGWGIEKLSGFLDIAEGLRQQWYDFTIDRLWWYLPEINSFGHLFELVASGEFRVLDGIFIIDQLTAKPLRKDEAINISGFLNVPDDRLQFSVETPRLHYANVAMMAPLRKDREFGLWMTRALPMATFTNLLLRYEGSLRPERLDDNNQLHGQADFSAQQFLYNHRWPALSSATATIHIHNDLIRINKAAGHFEDVAFVSDSMTLTNVFTKPVLSIAAATQGLAQTHVNYLSQSPLSAAVGEPLRALHPMGKINLAVELVIPMLKRLNMKTQVTVDAALDSVTVTLPVDRPLSGISGQVHYDRHEGVISGEELDFTFMGGEARGGFSAVVREDQSMTVTADIVGKFDSQRLFADTALSQYVKGVDEWHIQYVRQSDTQDKLSLQSPLKNTQLKLPNGLRKNPQSSLTLSIEKMSATTSILQANYPGVISAAVELAHDQAGALTLNRGNLALGEQATPTLTSPSGIQLSGKLADLDLAELANSTGEFVMRGGDLVINQLRWGRYVIDGPTRLIFDIDKFGDTEITADGDHIVGVISILNDVFWVDLATLSFRELPASGVAQKPLRIPLPEAIPGAHITIYQLIRNGRALGSVKFAGQRQGPEYVIDNMALNTGEGWVQGTGRLQNLRPFTRAVFDLSAGQFGHVSGVFSGFKHFTMQQLQVSGSALLNQSGNGPLLETGTAQAVARNGRFYALNPAALDILRVVNPVWLVNSINDPEAGQSLRVNEIQASLRLQPTYIAVDEVRIWSDLANFRVHGWVDRFTQELNLGVGIAPRLSGIGALAGTLLGGPIGAAIGAALGELPMLPGNVPPDMLSISGTIQKPIRQLLF